MVLQQGSSFAPSACMQGSVPAAAQSCGTRHVNGAGGLQPLLWVAPSPTSKQGEQTSLPEVCPVRCQALEVLQELTIMGGLACPALPYFICQQQLSTKMQASFSGLTPRRHLPFTRALIPQAHLTLMASALLPP